MTKVKAAPHQRAVTARQTAPDTGHTSGGSLEFSSMPAALVFGLLGLLLVVAPFYLSTLWQASVDVFGGDALVPQMTFLSLSVVACFLLALAGVRAPQSALSWIVIAFGAWCALSAFGSVYQHDTFIELSRVAGLIAWFFVARTVLLAEHAADAAASRTWLLGAIVLGADIVCGLALAGFIETRGRQAGTFFNSNLLANYCALALPLGLALLLKVRHQRVASILVVLSLLIIAGGLVVTSSKGGFLSTLIAFLVFGTAAWRARGHHIATVLRARRKAVLACSLLFLVIFGVLFQRTVLPRLQAAGGSELNSTMFRAYTWQSTLQMAQARPALGWGAGTYPSAYPQFAVTGFTRTAHQVWLQLASESGFPAALLLLAACATGVIYGWRALRASDDWPVAAGAISAVIAFIVHGCTDAGWNIISIALLLMIALAMLDSFTLKQPSTAPDQQSALNYFWLMAALVFGVLTLGHQRVVQGEDLASEAKELLARGAPEVALHRSQESTEVNPYSARLWHNRGRVEEALRRDATEFYLRASQLQPTRASYYVAVARSLGSEEKAREYYDRAVQLDANDTGNRLARAEYFEKIPRWNELAWRDYQEIARLYEAPYGRYPAVAEIINLDFVRAFVKLGERALAQKNKTQAKNYAERGLEVIARWHQNEAYMRPIMESNNPEGFAREARQVEELEAQLNNLKARAK